MEQRTREIYPTRTVYTFHAGGVALSVTFLSPLLPDDLDVLSRPLTYIVFDVASTDDRPHQVQLYMDVGAEWATDTFDQEVVWMRHRIEGVDAVRAGTQAQHILGRSGDDVRCDWGYVWLAAPDDGRQATATGADAALRSAFMGEGALPVTDDLSQPCPVSPRFPKLAASADLGSVTPAGARAWIMVAYEDLFCCEYMRRRLRPYWQRDESNMAELLQTAAGQFPDLLKRSIAFDRRILRSAEATGGPEYRDLCALAYRQAVAAHKLAADHDGSPILLSKENSSNGCVATVDVTYPSSPLFLLLNPRLLEAMITPVLEYARGPRWPFEFAPHDLGTFPLANGQVYGGGERSDAGQMPVEESGNMLLMVAALCEAAGSPEYAGRYWELLTAWARYLERKGFDPERQLCTDDFAGHLAHNANLSIKAILALAAYAKLAGLLGFKKECARLRKKIKAMAGRWMRRADDGDHYRLVFDKPGTWSQKYNLVWDKLLGLRVFPVSVARCEVAYYKKAQGTYGLPLDSRNTFTKLDWIVWSAALSSDRDDIRALLKPVHKWLQETPSRVPLADLYWTDSGENYVFRARSVVGGVFIGMLRDRWSSSQFRRRGKHRARGE
ncbi:MAG: DUF4965 domain-containing protein [Lentisphaerae bacterium]|nr:DUF4965 domain-containing protein [Lentisphaerota bacterium]